MKRSATATKSSKRLKLENEIFSKSIKDIERMFTSDDSIMSINENTVISTTTRNSDCSQYLPSLLAKSNNKYNYDCINLSFLAPTDGSPRASESHKNNHGSDKCTSKEQNTPHIRKWYKSKSAVPLLPSQSTKKSSNLVDFDFDDDLGDLPRKVNLEKDLKLIEQLIFLNY